jgi:hypothetical protein
MSQSASQNTPINVKHLSSPKIGVEGLLRLVETVARIQACQTLSQEENLLCLNEKLPPVSRDESVAQPARVSSPAPGLDSQSDVGKPDGTTPPAGAEP